MRSVKIKDIVDALERFAPLPLQESYDNAGLQVGLTDVEVSGALLCLDVTEAIIDEAIKLHCNLVVAHHPLIFRKLAQVTDANYIQRTIRKAIKNDITIVAMHTNLDAVEGGVNYKIAEKLGLEHVRILAERRTILNNKGEERTGGEGIIGELPTAIAADDLILMLKKRFNVECVQANQLLRRGIKKIALCGGAGSFLLNEAVKAGADAFITGDMSYHEFFGYEQKIQICAIGHYQSEQYTCELLKQIVEDSFPEVKCFVTNLCTNPIIYL